MTDEDTNILTAAAYNGLMALAVAALLKMDRAAGLAAVDAITEGRATLRFGVMISGRTSEYVGHLVESDTSRHLFTVSRTDPPAPAIN